MPRKPRFVHPLRKVRQATSESTQEKFGVLVGSSRPTIQAVENGKLPLSDRLARRIERATGADRRELQRGARGRALTVSGVPYTREFFETWRNMIRGAEDSTEDRVDAAANQLGFWTRLLIRASRSKEPGEEPATDRLTDARFALSGALQQVCEDLGLAGRIERLLRPLRKVVYCSARLEQWTTEGEHPASRALLRNIGRSGGFRDDAKITVSIDWVPRWSPDGRIPDNTPHQTDADSGGKEV